MVFLGVYSRLLGLEGGGAKTVLDMGLEGGLKPVLDVYSLKLAQKCLKFVKTITTLHLSQHGTIRFLRVPFPKTLRYLNFPLGSLS